MAKVVADVGAELKKLLAGEKLVLGAEVTLKLLRQGKLKKVFLASNCSPQVRDNIGRYCKVGNVECVDFSQTNEEIGVICKKPFAISVVGVIA